MFLRSFESVDPVLSSVWFH